MSGCCQAIKENQGTCLGVTLGITISGAVVVVALGVITMFVMGILGATSVVQMSVSTAAMLLKVSASIIGLTIILVCGLTCCPCCIKIAVACK